MKEKKLLLLLLFLSSVCTLKAQQKNVAGQVLEVNDEPLVGVTVMVDGTTPMALSPMLMVSSP